MRAGLELGVGVEVGAAEALGQEVEWVGASPPATEALRVSERTKERAKERESES